MVAMNKMFDLGVTVPGPAAFNQGWDPSIDLGTVADFYVDAVSGSDGNDGLTAGTAKATIAAAMALVTAGQRINLIGDGVKYREMVVMKSGVDDASRVQLIGHGTDRPIVTAAERLSGFVQCDATDAAVLGSTLGVNGSPVWKRSGLLKTDIADADPRALNIHESDIKLDIATDWAGTFKNDIFYQNNDFDWHDATTVNTTNGLIDEYILTSVTNAYTQAQIENAYLHGHTVPNANFYSAIASFNTTTNAIVLADQTQTYEINSKRNKFALFNILPNMKQGQWGWTDEGTTVTVYVYPNSGVSEIEYSAREHCINFNFQDHITVRGIECRQSAGVGATRTGIAIVCFFGATQRSNYTVENCRVAGTVSRKQAGIHFANVSNVEINNNTLENMQGSFGIYLSANVNNPVSATNFADGVSVQRNKIIKAGQSPLRFFTVRNAVVAHNWCTDSGWETHANKINFYEQSHAVLAWGNRFDNCGGYATYQEASGISFGFNIFGEPVYTGGVVTNSSRSFVDQNDSTTIPPIDYIADGLVSYVFNNSMPPDAVGSTGGGTASNGLDVTSNSAVYDAVKFTVINNLYHGHVVQSPTNVVSWTANWNTGADFGDHPGDTGASVADVYTDPANGDFSIGAGAAIRSATGDSIQGIIDVLQPIHDARFSNWHLDAFGETIINSSPPIGGSVAYKII